MGQVEAQAQPRATLPAAKTKAKAAAASWRLAMPMREASGVPVALRAVVGAVVAELVVLIALASSAGAATPSFVATNLGNLGGLGFPVRLPSTEASALNDRGQVVGSSLAAVGGGHAFCGREWAGWSISASSAAISARPAR